MSTGRIQHFGFTAGGAAPTSVYKGIITGGNHVIHSEPIPGIGIGSYKPFTTRPGLVSGSGSVDFDVNDDMKALLVGYGIRTAGALPEVCIQCGNTALDVMYHYAMCTGWGIKGEAGGKLSANFAWLARDAAEGAGAQTQTITAADPVYLWYEAAITGITGLSIRSFDVAVRHKVELDPVMATPGAGIVRMADAFADSGQDYIELRMTLRASAETPYLPLGDTLAAIASTVITFTSGEKTCVITLTNANLSEKNEDLSPAAIANKGVIFNCEDVTIA